ncbi:MAG: O-antigen ligase family protein [Gammaproteobacteria bacterium]|nr:O-antigen ligase family protein [Gammaproteobacteria bacterium]
MTFNNKYSLDDIRSSLTLNNFVVLLVFLFPITAATVKGAGDLIMFTLLVIAVVSFRFRDLKLLDNDKYIFIGFLVLFLVGALSMVNTENTVEGLKKLERLGGFPLSIFIYLYVLKNRLSLARVFMTGVMAASVIMVIQGWYQVEVLSYTNAIGAYHKIIFGDVSILFAVMTVLYSYFNDKVKKEYCFSFFAVLCALYASFLSGTRGAWLLVPLLLIIYVFKGFKADKKYVYSAISFFVVLVYLMFFNDYIFREFTEEFARLPTYISNEGVESGSFSWRVSVWKMSLAIWSDSPFFGTGLGDFFSEIKRMVRNDGGLEEVFLNATHAHSIYFDALVTTGLLGLVTLLVAVFLIPLLYLNMFSKGMGQSLILFVVLFSFMVFGLSEAWLARKFFVNLYLILMVVFLVEIKYFEINPLAKVDLINKSIKGGLGFILASAIAIVLVQYSNRSLEYLKFSPYEKLAYDLKHGEYNNDVVFESIRDVKRSMGGKLLAYRAPSKLMSCYNRESLYFVDDGNKNTELYSEKNIVKVYQRNKLGIFLYGDDDRVLYVLKRINENCIMDLKNIDLMSFISKTGYPISKNKISMYWNGVVTSPTFQVKKGRLSVHVGTESTCVFDKCSILSVQVVKSDDRGEEVLVNKSLSVGEGFESNSIVLDLDEDMQVYINFIFANDFSNKRLGLDRNLFIKMIRVDN